MTSVLATMPFEEVALDYPFIFNDRGFTKIASRQCEETGATYNAVSHNTAQDLWYFDGTELVDVL
jgi:hypothetical protein